MNGNLETHGIRVDVLMNHLDHELTVATWGNNRIENIAVVCEQCSEVLTDIDVNVTEPGGSE